MQEPIGEDSQIQDNSGPYKRHKKIEDHKEGMVVGKKQRRQLDDELEEPNFLISA
jgi:hypothetical protein